MFDFGKPVYWQQEIPGGPGAFLPEFMFSPRVCELTALKWPEVWLWVWMLVCFYYCFHSEINVLMWEFLTWTDRLCLTFGHFSHRQQSRLWPPAERGVCFVLFSRTLSYVMWCRSRDQRGAAIDQKGVLYRYTSCVWAPTNVGVPRSAGFTKGKVILREWAKTLLCFRIWVSSRSPPGASTVTACATTSEPQTGIINGVGSFSREAHHIASEPSRVANFPGRSQGHWIWGRSAATTPSHSRKDPHRSGTTRSFRAAWNWLIRSPYLERMLGSLRGLWFHPPTKSLAVLALMLSFKIRLVFLTDLPV